LIQVKFEISQLIKTDGNLDSERRPLFPSETRTHAPNSDLVLFVKFLLGSVGVDDLLHVLSLVLHVVHSELATALGALDLRVEPRDDALVMVAVAHVAWQRCHLVALVEVDEADRAVFDAVEACLVVGDLRCGVDHALTILLQLALRAVEIDAPVADAGKEQDKHGRDAAYYESLG